MYLKRTPLGEGNLIFGERRRKFPIWRVILYLIILGAALYAFWRKESIQPKIAEMIGPTPTPTLAPGELMFMAEEAYYAGEFEQAAAHYQQILQITPNDIEIMFRQARMLTLTHDVDNMHKALEIANQMIEIDRNDWRGYAAKARALDWIGGEDGLSQAMLAGGKAVELAPESAVARAYLGEVFTDLGRFGQARDQLELALKLDPFNVDVRRNYALLLEYFGNYEGAVQQYQQAILLPDGANMLDLYYGLARNYRGSGQYDLSVETYADIAERTPDDPLPYIELGKTYFEIRDDDAAQEFFSTALTLYEEREKDWLYLRTLTRLAQVYYTRRNFEDAITTLELAIEWGEANGYEVPIEAYYVTASAYYYLDVCQDDPNDEWVTGAVPRMLEAFDIYKERRMDDPNALNTILSVFVLCRDWAGEPYMHNGPGFTNGFPDGYEEPCVYVPKPGEEVPDDICPGD